MSCKVEVRTTLLTLLFFFLLLQHISLKLTECLEGPQRELGSLEWWQCGEQYSSFSFLHADQILTALKKLLVSTSGDHEFEKVLYVTQMLSL